MTLHLTDAEVDQLREALDSVGHTVMCTYWRDEYRCTCNMVEVEAALAMLDAKAGEQGEGV